MLGFVASARGMEAESAWAVVVALVLAWVREQGLPAQRKKMEGVG